MIHILIVGAIDRFNYGDLLFPIVIEKEIKKTINKDVDFEFYGLIQSNLINSGGKATKSLIDLYYDANNKENVTIIVAGGEVLTPDWAVLNAYLSKRYKFIYDIILKLKSFIPYSRKALDQIASRQLGGKTKYPFILEPEKFKSDLKIVYNAVGGYNIAKLNRKELLNSIPKYTYFSVREQKAYSYFLENNLTNVELRPDSAILISDHYPINDLKSLASKEAVKVVDSYQSGYVTFQVAYYKFIQNKKAIIELIDSISERYGFSIVLCPIGTALGHEDHKAANEIERLTKADTYTSSFENIWDIMYLIASSKLFIGTSLHGTITAMTYNIPYICVDKEQFKLQAYLETWAPPSLNETRSFEEVLEKIERVLEIPEKVFNENRNYQIELVKESFKSITSVIN